MNRVSAPARGNGRKAPTVGRLLSRSFGVLVMLLLLNGVVAVIALQQQSSVVSELSERVLPTRLANNQLRVVLSDAQRNVRGYLLTGDSRFHDGYQEALTAYPGVVADLRRLAGRRDARVVHRMVQRADSWLDIAERQDKAQPRSDIAAVLVERGKDLFDNFLNDNKAYDQVMADRAGDLREQARQTHLAALAALVGFALLGSLVATLTAVRASRRIRPPLSGLVATLTRLGDGDLTARATPDRGPAEVREVARAVNAMADEVDAARRTQAEMFAREQLLVAELREVDKVKTEFLSSVSHELRTPLTSISGYTELLRDADAGPLSPMQDRMLETIERNTARLRNLIEDLLTLSRAESGGFTTHRSPQDLGELVESAVHAIEPSTRGVVDLDVFYPDHTITAEVDRNQIDRLLMNLLSNAVKFTPPGGRVTVRLEDATDEAVLTVADTGIGIPERDREQLFTRFFRAGNAVEKAIPGTGLGLTLVRTIVANHDGRIELESAVGQGTTFRVRLPKALSGAAVR